MQFKPNSPKYDCLYVAECSGYGPLLVPLIKCCKARSLLSQPDHCLPQHCWDFYHSCRGTGELLTDQTHKNNLQLHSPCTNQHSHPVSLHIFQSLLNYPLVVSLKN